MIKVVALTAGEHVPSSRFRVRQHIDLLGHFGVEVSEYYPGHLAFGRGLPRNETRLRYNPHLYPLVAINTAGNFLLRVPSVIKSLNGQITWLSRGLFPGYPSLEYFLKTPLVLDVDDAVWLNKPFGGLETRRAATRAARVIAGNNFIADYYSKYNQNVSIIPTAVDSTAYVPAKTRSSERFIIGWIGTAGNYPYLYNIEEALWVFLRKFNTAQLVIVGERPPSFKKLSSSMFRFIGWSPSLEVNCIQGFNVGIMPLTDSEWSRGKCSFKMLQYMSCEVPVICSPVGMNRQVLSESGAGIAASNHEEWVGALEALYTDEALASKLAANGRRAILSKYDTRKVTEQLAYIFRNAI